MSEKVVTIFGTGNAKPQEPTYKLAFETGRLLAQSGFTIANGGYGGSMLAAAQGAAKAGGKTIGVTCRKFTAKPNKFISREITTDSLEQRLDTLVKLGQAYVVVPGATGTLLELAMVWELKNKGFLKPEKPIIKARKTDYTVRRVLETAAGDDCRQRTESPTMRPDCRQPRTGQGYFGK
jgi:uncharacterized protein (TIGR00725 family)